MLHRPMLVAAMGAAVIAIIICAERRRNNRKREQVDRKHKSPLPETTEEKNVDGITAASSVRLAADAGELLAICRLRWLVYVGELKRQNYAYVDHVRHILEDPLDHVPGVQNLYIALPAADAESGRVVDLGEGLLPDGVGDSEALSLQAVGCVRVHVPCPTKYDSLFSMGDARVWGTFASQPSAFAFFSRFMVHARHRGKGHGGGLGFADQLYVAAAVAARHAGARFLLLNCTPALAPLYEARGFVRYKPACWDDAMGLQVPMALVLDDLAFLRRSDPNGPVTAAVRDLAASSSPPAGFPDPAACRWLSKLLDERPAVLVSSRCHDVEALRRFVDARGIEFSHMALFSGVGEAERTELLTRCPGAMSVLDVLPNTLISRKGDVRDESFLVLRGSVDVDGGIETLASGAVVGESAFLSGEQRVCTIRVTGGEGSTPGRDDAAEGGALLLCTSRVGFQKAMRVVPAIAVKLLWNMATGLSKKVSEEPARSDRRARRLASRAC